MNIKSVVRSVAALVGVLLPLCGIYWRTRNIECPQEAVRKCVQPTTETVFSGPDRPPTRTVTVVSAYYDVQRPSNCLRSIYIWNLSKTSSQKFPVICIFLRTKLTIQSFSSSRNHIFRRRFFIIKELSDLAETQRMEVWKKQHKIDPVTKRTLYRSYSKVLNCTLYHRKDSYGY